GYKSFYVTKGDFWSGNGGVSPAGLGSVSIKPVTPATTGPVDLALGATATASNYYQSFTPDRAVNGQWGSGYEGWVTNVGKPQWLALDLGSVKDISRYVIKFDSAARPGNDANTGKDFILQTSVDGTTWTNLDTTTGNTAAIFDKTLPTFSTRYIRIYLNTPTQETTSDSINNPRARIGAFELYGSASAATPPPPATTFLEKENILDAKVDTDVNIGGADLTMHTWVAANDNIVVTQLTSDADKAVDLQLQTWAGAGSAKAGTVSTAGVDGSTLWATRSTSPNGTGWVSRAALATRLLGATLSNTGATGPTASGQF
ncbi:discoidin domain-containing protein, partial [Paenibacillus sp. TAF58]